jgi:hypothetical protein
MLSKLHGQESSQPRVAKMLYDPLLAVTAPPRGDHPESESLWIEVPDSEVGRSPAWMTRVGLAPDGTIYLPAAFAGDELEMAERATREGQYPVIYMNHAFTPADWIARVAPDKADLCASAESFAVHFFTGKDLP